MQDFLVTLATWFLHLDVHLSELVALHGDRVYLLAPTEN